LLKCVAGIKYVDLFIFSNTKTLVSEDTKSNFFGLVIFKQRFKQFKILWVPFWKFRNFSGNEVCTSCGFLSFHGFLPSFLAFFLFDTAIRLAPERAELSPWLSPVLVLPVLQLLSCSGLTEPLSDQRTHSLNHSLAHSLLRSISKPTDKIRQVTIKQPTLFLEEMS